MASFVTSLGSGHALLLASGTAVMGGDAHFFFTGTLRQTGKFLSIALKIRRHTAGRPSVLNLDEYDLNLTGPAASLRFAGTSPQMPGVSSTVILERAPVGGDHAGWREMLERCLGADQPASADDSAASKSAAGPVPKT
ncbi:MAG: hypothetical protein IT548_14225 [Alphaproteobacteria bacterium]|nr:hypothetical protein [Alphaproteobacteria bacterium]